MNFELSKTNSSFIIHHSKFIKMSKKTITITKKSGEEVVFEFGKLYQSLRRSGASEAVIHEIIDEIEYTLHDGITTQEIHKKVFDLLRKKSRPNAARYKLKKAILELGPSGFPFEKFIAEIIARQGYKVKTNIIMQGNCVTHEVDVVAEKDKHCGLVECKFHNVQGRVSDVKVALYIHARFMDIERYLKNHPDHEHKTYQGWIFTNTKFSSDAIQYGKCAGLKLVGWNFPEKGNLKELVDTYGLHPITCLTTITKQEKEKFLSKNNVLSRDLLNNPNLLEDIGIPKGRHHKILDEVRNLCQS